MSRLLSRNKIFWSLTILAKFTNIYNIYIFAQKIEKKYFIVAALKVSIVITKARHFENNVHCYKFIYTFTLSYFSTLILDVAAPSNYNFVPNKQVFSKVKLCSFLRLKL